MTKKQYKEAIKPFPDLQFRAWLDYLPVTDEQGEPIKTNVPIVLVPGDRYEEIEQQINAAGFHFAWSTINDIPGYHFSKEFCARAFVKTV